MIYLNPYELLNCKPNELLKPNEIKKAIRKLLLEFDLSEDNTIEYHRNRISKNDTLQSLEEFKQKENLDFHTLIYNDKDLLFFLAEGNYASFEKIKKEKYYNKRELINFIAPFYIKYYSNQLSDSINKNEIEKVECLIENNLLENTFWEADCYKKANIRIQNFSSDIELIKINNKNICVLKKQVNSLKKYLVNEEKLKILQVLPEYFEDSINEICEKLWDFACEIYIKQKDMSICSFISKIYRKPFLPPIKTPEEKEQRKKIKNPLLFVSLLFISGLFVFIQHSNMHLNTAAAKNIEVSFCPTFHEIEPELKKGYWVKTEKKLIKNRKNKK